MHPVEHFFYFSCFLLAYLVPYHPLHLLLNKYHTDISALGGHDGYGPPGADDVGHYLHHSKFECNYGFSFPNYLDRAFGTYEDGSKCAQYLHTIVMSDVSRTTERVWTGM
jgi:sterol desaturase/sphingolipid hydroxylase (fatty acid hydroxylase superfamily)